MTEPQRLRDFDPEAAELFRAAAIYRPPHGMRRRLLRATIVPAAIAAPAAAAWAGASKVWIVACGAAVTMTAAGGVVAYRHQVDRRADATNHAPAREKVVVARPPIEVPPLVDSPVGVVAPAVSAESIVVPPARAAAAVRAVARPRAAAEPTPVAPEAPHSALDRELSVLNEAATALRRGDSGRALWLLDEYAHAFPDGTLADESLVMRIAAHQAHGDRVQVGADGEAFLRQHPGSVFGARVRSLLDEQDTHNLLKTRSKEIR
jgi:hypothetical protein